MSVVRDGPAKPGDVADRAVQLGLPARARAACIGLVGLVTALVRAAAPPLTNTDTYFHLRFGQEFLDGWSLRHPGSVSTFATARLGADPVAVGDRDGQDRGLVRAGRRRLAVGLPRDRAVRRRSTSCAATARSRLVAAAVTAAPSSRCRTGSRCGRRCSATCWSRSSSGLAAHPARRPRPLVAGPAHWVWAMLHGMWPVALVIGGVAVVGLALDRDLPGACSSAAARSRRLGGRRRLHARRARAVHRRAPRSGRARYFAEWGPARLDRRPWIVWRCCSSSPSSPCGARPRTLDRAPAGRAGALCASGPGGPSRSRRDAGAPVAGAGPGPSGPGVRRRPERTLVVGGGACSRSRAGRGRTAHLRPTRRPQPAWVDPALRSLPAGHQGARRLGPGRLLDVALPPARPDDARVRRHVHHRRAPPQHRHHRARARLGPGCADRVHRSRCSGPRAPSPTPSCTRSTGASSTAHLASRSCRLRRGGARADDRPPAHHGPTRPPPKG